MMLIRLIVVGLLFCSWPALAAAADDAVIWVDVRTPEEYAAGHIEGHPNIPYEQIGQGITGLTTDKSAPIRLYCQSGRRAGFALATLQAMGYTDVVNMGGWAAVAATLEAPVETTPAAAAQ